jgi:LmbE family N-acetylglucosaminyl deacetylase
MTRPHDGRSPVPPTGVLVCFHAHPDDEVFTTGGVMRLAADAGHRVVLVTATDGALGEVPQGLLAQGERLVDRRRSIGSTCCTTSSPCPNDLRARPA